MLMTLLTLFIVLAASVLLLRKFWLFCFSKAKPVYLKSFEASWTRESSLLDKPLSVVVFKMDIIPTVEYFVLRQGGKIIIWGTGCYLEKLNQNPNSEIPKLITQKRFDTSNAFFQTVWIFYNLKEHLFFKLKNLEGKLLRQVLIFIFMPFDTTLNSIWSYFINRNEFDREYWNKKSDLWLEFVI